MTEPSPRVDNDLEEAMLAVRSDPEVMDGFLDLLAAHDLFIPQDRDPRALRADQVLFPVARDGAQKGVPAFTSKERLMELGADRWVAIRGCDLSALWERETYLLLNPGSDLAMEIPPHAVLRLAGRREATRESMPADSRIRIGEPAREPRALLHAAARFARGHPEVVAAYRALIEPHDSGIEAFPAIGLKLESGVDDDDTLQLLAAAVTPVAQGRVTFLSVRENSEDPIAAYMLEESRPFYERDRHGGAVRPVLVVVPDSEPAPHTGDQ